MQFLLTNPSPPEIQRRKLWFACSRERLDLVERLLFSLFISWFVDFFGVICVPQMTVLQLRGRSCPHIKCCLRPMVNDLFFNVFYLLFVFDCWCCKYDIFLLLSDKMCTFAHCLTFGVYKCKSKQLGWLSGWVQPLFLPPCARTQNF